MTTNTLTCLADVHGSLLDMRDLVEIKSTMDAKVAEHESDEHEEFDDECPFCMRSEDDMDLMDLWDAIRVLEAQLYESIEGFAENEPTMVADDYFEEYAEELADDLGLLAGSNEWPARCIDWKRAAEELQQDYMLLTFDDREYWVRSC